MSLATDQETYRLPQSPAKGDKRIAADEVFPETEHFTWWYKVT